MKDWNIDEVFFIIEEYLTYCKNKIGVYMEQDMIKAEMLIKKILKEKSFVSLTDEEKSFLIDFYDDDMKAVMKSYKEYLLLPVLEKLVNIVIYTLKEYLGSWHVTTEEMEEISQYLQNIAKEK